MTLVDLNVVLYAINTAAAHHADTGAWWECATNGDEPVGLAWPVITGFLRLSTHASVLRRPLTLICYPAAPRDGRCTRHDARRAGGSHATNL